jgi:nicotinate-nucleotide pyrophosphorylase (carboxylating)
MNWNAPEIRTLIRTALREDAAHHDKTTHLLIPSDLRIEAEIRAKANGVVCGLPLAHKFFEALDQHVVFRIMKPDGTVVKNGDGLARLHGTAHAILGVERSALNALQHLSGIATFTRIQVRKLGSSKTCLLDTRKTLPGWRTLQKYAVHCGGATNHRSSLAQEILIKENHLKICRLAGLNWKRAVRPVLRAVELEVQTEKDLRDAVILKPAKILLDNWSPARLREYIKVIRRQSPQTRIEISGGVKPMQLPVVGRLGADFISMGRLTHSVKAFDCSLDILRVLK